MGSDAPQIIGGTLGAVGGFMVGGPVGAAAGASLGSQLSNVAVGEDFDIGEGLMIGALAGTAGLGATALPATAAFSGTGFGAGGALGLGELGGATLASAPPGTAAAAGAVPSGLTSLPAGVQGPVIPSAGSNFMASTPQAAPGFFSEAGSFVKENPLAAIIGGQALGQGVGSIFGGGEPTRPSPQLPPASQRSQAGQPVASVFAQLQAAEEARRKQQQLGRFA